MSGTLKVGGKTLATHVTTPAGNEISFHPDVMATTAQVQGVHTTSTVSIGSASLTINSFVSGSSVSNGDYVVGEGITPGTTVSSGGGTTSITLSANAGATLSSDSVSFYNSTKALSAGTVAGGLCRAWVNFDGVNQTIRAAYNISSISYSSGDYTVNFATPMPDENYSVVCSGSIESSNVRRGSSVGPRGSASFDNAANSYSTGSIRILSAIYGTSSLDPTLLNLDVVNVTIFR
jgi:hypothetical protein